MVVAVDADLRGRRPRAGRASRAPGPPRPPCARRRPRAARRARGPPARGAISPAHPATSSRPTGSGRKSASRSSEASAACRPPVIAPRRRTSSTSGSGTSGPGRRASRVPRASRPRGSIRPRYSARTPGAPRASRARPRPAYSTQPASRGTWRKAVRVVRKRVISRSGLRPGWGRRSDFSTRSPTTTGGIALLAGEAPRGQRVRIGRKRPARGGPESEAAVAAVGRAAGGDGGEHAAAEARVVVGVHHRLRAGAGERGLRRALGRHGDRDVVGVAVHREEQEHERPVGIEDGPVEHLHRRDAAGLGREPALADQEAREIGAAGAREQRDERGGIRAERPRCHRGAGRAAAAAAGTSSSRRAPG